MTDKFIPFNPETAKNGDVVYGICGRDAYLYVGIDPLNKRGYVLWDVKAKHYVWVQGCHLEIKAPKKIVWVNVYNYKGKIEVYPHPTKEKAEEDLDKNHYFIGTYQLEIDDVA